MAVKQTEHAKNVIHFRHNGNKRKGRGELLKKIQESYPLTNPDASEKYIIYWLIENGTAETDKTRDLFLQVKSEWFFSEKIKTIYQAVIGVYTDKEITDIYAINEYLKAKGRADLIAEVHAIVHNPAFIGSLDIDYHIERLKTAYATRQMQMTCFGVLAGLAESRLSLQESTILLNRKINVVNELLEDEKTVKRMEQVVLDTINSLYAGSLEIGMPTGFSEIDEVTAGLQNGEYVVVGARPSIGKSAFADAILWYQAETIGIPTLMISIEMTEKQVVERKVASIIKKRIGEIRTEGISEQEINEVVERTAEVPMYYVFDVSYFIDIEKAIQEYVEKHNVKVVAIDYLQLMKFKPSRFYESREREIAEISANLKRLAKKLNICIIVLSQLNRNLEYRRERRPMLADLRDSGSIEQDADLVMLLHRELDRETGGYEPVTEVIIAKGRNVGTQIVRLYWNPDFMSFVEQPRSFDEDRQF